MIYISGVPNFERKVPNRYFGPVNCNPQAKRPFGFMAHDGLNFSRSVTDRNSRLARIVRYLQGRRGMITTRMDILQDVFHIHPDPMTGIFYKTVSLGKRYEIRGPRGYNGCVFSGARKAGFIYTRRIGRMVSYELGPNANKVTI